MREQEQEYKYRHQLSPLPLAKGFDDSCLRYLLNQALLLPTTSLHSDESYFGDCCQKKLRHLSRSDVTLVTSEQFVLRTHTASGIPHFNATKPAKFSLKRNEIQQGA